MPVGAIVLLDSTMPDDALDGWRDAARDFGAAAAIDIRLMTGDERGARVPARQPAS